MREIGRSAVSARQFFGFSPNDNLPVLILLRACCSCAGQQNTGKRNGEKSAK